MECAFHGKSPEEEEKREREIHVPDVEEEFEVRGEQRGLAPARDRTGPRPAPFESFDELVPVAVREPVVEPLQAAVFEAAAFPDVGIPLLPPAIGAPLYLPDENIPEGTFPPGFAADGAAEIGVLGEEAFAEMIAGAEVSKALQTSFMEEAFPNVGVLETFEGANPAFSELGWLFSALFAANAVAHLWQTFNASTPAGAPKGPVIISANASSPRTPISAAPSAAKPGGNVPSGIFSSGR